MNSQLLRPNPFKTDLVRRVATTLDKIPMGAFESRQYLQRRVAEAEFAARRSNHRLGRFLNWATGVDTEVVFLTGPVLWVVLNELGRDLPEGFQRSLNYCVKLGLAQELRDEMAAKRIGEAAA